MASEAKDPEGASRPLRLIPGAAGSPEQMTRLIAISTTGLLILAVFYTFYFARTFFAPVIIALLLNLVLSPVVRRLSKAGLPESIGAAVVLLLLFGAVGYGVFQLSGPAAEWLERAPQSFRALEQKLKEFKEPVEEVQKATEKVEELTEVDEAVGAPAVVVKGPGLAETFFTSTYSVVAAGSVSVVLLYFLLASGDLFLRKLVRVLPRLDDKKMAIEIARRCERDVSAYLLTITCINIVLGCITGVTMHLIGLPNPVLWGVLAGLANFVPYLGPATVVGVLALVGLTTFDDWTQIVQPPGAFLLFTALEGQLLTPIILGRRLTLNPVVIFLALLVWGWLWGVVGILLAVPLLAAFKILCDNVPPLKTVGQFLGRREQEHAAADRDDEAPARA